MDEDYEADRFSDAVRLLLLIAAVAEDLDDAAKASAPKGAVAVLHAEGRLQKLDFWLRNPDYLADELLNDYERSGEPILLDLAGNILDSDEPEIYAIPMLRYLFGAFEALDRALSVLVAPRLLIVTQRRTVHRVLQDNYYLTAKGRSVAEEAAERFAELQWYTDRALLVKALAEGTGHSALALRRRQYLQRDYAETPLNEVIPSIAGRARVRLAQLRAARDQGSAA
ncbi:hypothetical protein ABZ352_03865 [Streptomyces griseofuscus]|uniref:hypothetical protein n=1 Tax=Streptomyces griseofuscus TaxID=146922 RepID=UPI0033F37D74